MGCRASAQGFHDEPDDDDEPCGEPDGESDKEADDGDIDEATKTWIRLVRKAQRTRTLQIYFAFVSQHLQQFGKDVRRRLINNWPPGRR